jgi:hypothetical protein
MPVTQIKKEIELISIGSNRKGWVVQVLFEVVTGCYCVRIEIQDVRLVNPELESFDITNVWEKLVPNLYSELKKKRNLILKRNERQINLLRDWPYTIR